MPVELGLVDTNVLVYALDDDAAQHASSRVLLEAGRAASLAPELETIGDFTSTRNASSGIG